MLSHISTTWFILSYPIKSILCSTPSVPLNRTNCKYSYFSHEALNLSKIRFPSSTTTALYAARRSVRYDDDEDDHEEYGHNEEIAMLELYSQTARGEALLVHAVVDDQQVEVLIFKGFSSSLSYETSPDPSKSILPARAVIKTIDRVKGPFDPSNIEYLQRDLTWKAFKSIYLI